MSSPSEGLNPWIKYWESRTRKLDWKVLLICILVASSLWFFGIFSSQKEFELKYSVLVNVDEISCELETQSHQDLSVFVEAKGFDLGNGWFQRSHGSVEIPPSELRCQSKGIPTKTLGSLILPQLNEGLSINRIEPDTIFFNFKTKASITLPIVVQGSPKDKRGFVFTGEYLIEPSEVQIISAEDNPPTQIVLDYPSESQGIEELSITAGFAESISTNSIEVTPLYDTLISRSIQVRPVIRESGITYTFLPQQITVSIIGTEDQVGLLANQITSVTAQPSTDGKARLKLDQKIPEGVQVILEPSEVDFFAKP
ncbi:MAG: hypothetical protein HRT74_03315 [Flavobacteriales bacterium]|nr:hypothetical protein [Flavobacteriales bacterium]